MEMNDFIIKRIDELCKKRNMTYYRLAEISGVTQSTISTIKNRKTTPSIRILKAFCDAFGITLSQFFADDNKTLNLTLEQEELLETWNSLSDVNKLRIISYLDGMTGK